MGRLKKGYLTVMRWISRAEIFISSAILAALILVTIIGTLTRYFLRMPFTWIEEFQLACVVWIVFLAGSAAFASKAHVAIEMVVEMLPKRVQRAFDLLIGVTVILVLLFVIRTSMEYMEVFIRSGRTTPILKLPYVGIYGIVPVSCGLMILEYFHSLAEPVKEDKTEEELLL